MEPTGGGGVGRRAFLAILGIGVVGGMIGLKLFRNVGFKKRPAMAQAPKKQTSIKPNPLAISRTGRDK